MSMSNALDVMVEASSQAINGIAEAMTGLSHDDRVKLDYAIHQAHLRLWKAEGQARNDWFGQTRIATDPFVRRMAYIYTAGYFAVLVLAWVAGLPKDGHDLFITLIGALTTTQVGISAYCFGSTSSNARKDDLLYRSTPAKDG